MLSIQESTVFISSQTFQRSPKMKLRMALAIVLMAVLVNQIYSHSLSHSGKISNLQKNQFSVY